MRPRDTDILALAESRGLDITDLSEEQYLSLALELRSPGQTVKDGSKALVASVKSSLRIGIDRELGQKNLKVCRQNRCGRYGVLKNGIEVCHKCNCSGRRLRSKTEQTDEHCPEVDPSTNEYFWDNRTALTVKGKDANRN